mmetsp:Transcript_78957/g.205259  ORF Transcript_78957/g.205259 Transcript_78957/m.205259 type:complete len:405 (+) Transcript_78957:343-1557(+)
MLAGDRPQQQPNDEIRAIRGSSHRLVCVSDVPAGHETLFVRLNQGLRALCHSLHHVVVNLGHDIHPVQKLHQCVDRKPEVGLLLQQRPLALVDARILVRDHLEACPLDRCLEDVRITCLHTTQDRLVNVFHSLVLSVALVEGCAHHIVLERNPGTRLHHSVDLAEKSCEVCRVAQDLHVVRRVQAVVGKWQAVVVVSNLEIQLLPQQSGLLSVLSGQPDLLLVDIEARDMCSRVRGHVVGNPAAAATNVRHLGTLLDLQVIGHLLLIEPLVLIDVLVLIQVRRQIHLLEVPDGAQVIQDTVVIGQQIHLARSADELVLFEHFVRQQEALQLVMGHGPDCADRSGGGGDAIPQVFPRAAHVRQPDGWHREHRGKVGGRLHRDRGSNCSGSHAHLGFTEGAPLGDK